MYTRAKILNFSGKLKKQTNSPKTVNSESLNFSGKTQKMNKFNKNGKLWKSEFFRENSKNKQIQQKLWTLNFPGKLKNVKKYLTLNK